MRRQLRLPHASLHTAAVVRTMGVNPSQKVAGKPLKAELASAAAMAAAAKRFAAIGKVNSHSISLPDLWSIVHDASTADTARARHFAIPFALPPPPPAPPAAAKPQWMLRGEAPPGAMTPAVSGGFWASLANVRPDASWAAMRASAAAASTVTPSGNASKAAAQALAQAEARSALTHLPETPAVAPARSAELLSRYRVASMSQMFDLQETAAEDAQAAIRAAAAARKTAPSSARLAAPLHARAVDANAHDNLLHPSLQPAVVVGTHPPSAAVGPLTGLAAAAAGVRRLHTSTARHEGTGSGSDSKVKFVIASDASDAAPASASGSAARGAAGGRPQGVRFCEEQQELEGEGEGEGGSRMPRRPAFSSTKWPAAASDLDLSSGDEHYDWLASAHAAMTEAVGSGRHIVVRHDDRWGDLHAQLSPHPHSGHHHHHGHHGSYPHAAAEGHGHGHGPARASGHSGSGGHHGAALPGSGGTHPSRHLSTAVVLAAASGRTLPYARARPPASLGRRHMGTMPQPQPQPQPDRDAAAAGAVTGAGEGRFAVDGPPAASAQQIAAVEGNEADADVVDVDQATLSRREPLTQGYRADQADAAASASSELHESDAAVGHSSSELHESDATNAQSQPRLTNAQRRAAAYAAAMRARFGADGPPAPDVQALHAMAQQYDAIAIGQAEMAIARPPFRETAVPGRGDAGGLAVHPPGRTGPHRHCGHAVPPQRAALPAQPAAARSALYNPVGRGSLAEPEAHLNADGLPLEAETEIRVTEHMPQGRDPLRPLGNEHHTPPVPESLRPRPSPPVAAGYKDDARALWNEPLVGAEHVYPGGSDDGWVGEAIEEALQEQDDAAAVLRGAPLPVPEINPAAPQLSAAAAAARHGAAVVARSHAYDTPEGAVAPSASGAALSRHAVKGIGAGALREAVRADRDIDAELAADVMEGDAGEESEGRVRGDAQRDALGAAGYPRLGVTGMTAAGIRGSAADPSLANRWGTPGPIPSVGGGHKAPHSRQRRGIATWVLADGAGAVHWPRIPVRHHDTADMMPNSVARTVLGAAAALHPADAAVLTQPEAAAAADAAHSRCEGVSRVTLPGMGTGPQPTPPPSPAGTAGPHRPTPEPGSALGPGGRGAPRNAGPELGEGPEVDQPSGPGAGGTGPRRPGPRPGQQPPGGAGPIHGTPVVQQGRSGSAAAAQAFSGAVDGQAATAAQSGTSAGSESSGRAAAADRSEALGDGGGGAAELGLGGRQPAARSAVTGSSNADVQGAVVNAATPYASSGNLTLDESPAVQRELDAALAEAEAERDGVLPAGQMAASSSASTAVPGTGASSGAPRPRTSRSSQASESMQHHDREGLGRPAAATANGEGLCIAARRPASGSISSTQANSASPRRSFGTLATGWEAGSGSGLGSGSTGGNAGPWRIVDLSPPAPPAPTGKAAESSASSLRSAYESEPESPTKAAPDNVAAAAGAMRPGIAGVETDDADLSESTVDHQHDAQWAEHWAAADRSHLQREAHAQPAQHMEEPEVDALASGFASIVRSLEASQVGLPVGFDHDRRDDHHHDAQAGVPGVETDDADYAISVSDSELDVPQAQALAEGHVARQPGRARERQFQSDSEMRAAVQAPSQQRSAPQATFGAAASAAPASNGSISGNGNGNVKAKPPFESAAAIESAEEARLRYERARRIAKDAAKAAKADAMAAAAAVAEKTHLSERAQEARDAAATMVAAAAAAAEAALPRSRYFSESQRGSASSSAPASPLEDTASAVLGLGKSAVVLAGAATATVAAAVGAVVKDVAKAVPVAAHEAKVAYEAMTPVRREQHARAAAQHPLLHGTRLGVPERAEASSSDLSEADAEPQKLSQVRLAAKAQDAGTAGSLFVSPSQRPQGAAPAGLNASFDLWQRGMHQAGRGTGPSGR